MSEKRDRRLVNYVRLKIRAGHTHIRIPASLLKGTSDLARQDVKDLCRINKVKFTIVAGK